MTDINIAQFEDSIVLHFETSATRINAYTLASTLVAIADAAKAANVTINPGHEIEVVVEAIAPGSFRAKIKAIYQSRGGLLAKEVLWGGIALGVIGNWVYDKTLAPDDSVKVEVNTDEVIIIQGNDRVIIPRNVREATDQAEKNPEFQKSMTRVFEAISRDGDISGFALLADINSTEPPVIVPRANLQMASLRTMDLPDERVIPEIVDLQIIKAILERSKRKWEFVWRGVRISAPITSEKFYIDFFAHDITIAPGDVLNVTLHVHQKKDSSTGIYRNVKYDVVDVHSHTPRVRQLNLSPPHQES